MSRPPPPASLPGPALLTLTPENIDWLLREVARQGQGMEFLMTQNDALSQAFTRHETATTDTLAEIVTEISDLATALANQAGMQAFADRLNATSARLEEATANLRADNMPPAAPPA